ncbi:MAG TPA: Gfo/Idh/MocA family oxidoreductase [Capsulimonadaceae bacterium]|jgi:predicted dehydrogenase
MNVGIVGAGNMSTHHAKAYHACGAQIAAVCDISEATYLARKEHFGDAKYFSSYDEMFAGDTIDAVSICVGTRFHFDIVAAAVKRGKHVLCEKTMTESAERSAELVKLVDQSGVNFQIGYMKRYFPATIKVTELIPSLGEIFSAHIRSYQGHEGVHGAEMYDKDSWKPLNGKMSPTKAYACGGILNMAGSHMLDLLHLFLGEPATVYSANWSPAAYDAEMSGNALITMASGAVAHLDACVSPYSRTGTWNDGWDECIALHGKLGKLEVFYPMWDRPENNAPLVIHYDEPSQTTTTLTFPKVNAFNAQVAAFVANCESGTPSNPGVRDGYVVDSILSACYESAASGQAVKI